MAEFRICFDVSAIREIPYAGYIKDPRAETGSW
jgi:hypothetical protein